MKFSPKHNDKGLRILYIILAFATIPFLLIQNKEYRWLYITLAMVCLCSAVYLIISFELTTYTYIFNAKESSYDFYVDKANGSRNAYVVFYPMADLVYFGKMENSTKAELSNKYQKIHYFRLMHNVFNTSPHVLVFKNNDFYEAIEIDLDQASASEVNRIIGLEHLSLDTLKNEQK